MSGVLAAVAFTVLGIAGCGKSAAPPAEEIRPVRIQLAHAAPVESENTYAGVVRARYESSLGFRVPGKIVERRVNVGESVKAGEVLARLDAKDLALSEASSKANVAAQEASFEIEKADLDRFQGLLAQGFISRADYERQAAKLHAAQAQLEALRATYRVSANQAQYADLVADHAGVISGIAAETGQVVAAGQPVVNLAWSGEIEVASDIPEDQVHRIHIGMDVQVSLWTDEKTVVSGQIRELSSNADPATRTYSMRVQLPHPPDTIRLGMTASVRIPGADTPPVFRVPVASFTEVNGRKGVWILEGASTTARFREVTTLGVSGNDLLVGSGFSEGDRIVTAGAGFLHEGQKVRPLTDLPQGN